jgi:hypothetical protein
MKNSPCPMSSRSVPGIRPWTGPLPARAPKGQVHGLRHGLLRARAPEEQVHALKMACSQ